MIAHDVVDILSEARLPDGVVNLFTGGGGAVGQPLVEHEDVDGIVFTGSREVGRGIQETFLEQDKAGPVIAEHGGKNPVIVTENADLEKAVSGVTKGRIRARRTEVFSDVSGVRPQGGDRDVHP